MAKSVLITGSNSGIGAAAAFEFSKRGYFVFLLGRNKERLQSIHQQISNSTIIECDLAQSEQVQKAVQKVLQHPQCANLECLVNNAGIFLPHDFLGGTHKIWEEQFRINLFGPVELTQGLWGHFKKLARGSIVNVSSTLGIKPTETTGAYSATKAAMINWTQSLAIEGGPLGIRVNAVSPGLVDTPIHSFHNQEKAEKTKTLESLKSMQPLGRIGTPDEIAKAIVFLGTEDSSWTTGANLAVDGGIYLA